ncbi:MAG: class I SAM-dependent methyltransferase [Planctomycetota bacterium]|jgi:SAM-dependent methyltransferase
MREVACYNCGSDESAFYAEENGFRLVRCDGCGLLYVKARPDDAEIDEAHRTGLHGGDEQLEVTGAFGDARVRELVELLRGLYGRNAAWPAWSWLDIGCGHGEFLVALREFFGGKVRVRGVEPNAAKRRSAADRGMVLMESVPPPRDGRYDVISALNVFSHLPDPPAALAEWSRLLKPGGEILVETGDTAGLDSSRHHRPFHLPDHLSFASERIVVSILARTGFEILQVRKFPVVRLGALAVTKEIAKIFWPGKTSALARMMKLRMLGRTDMYVRARLTGQPTGRAEREEDRA